MIKKKHFVYRIYYGNEIVYVGRTSQKDLEKRLYQHFFKPLNKRLIEISKVSKVEYTILETDADSFLVELYYIAMLKPTLNTDAKPKQNLTLSLSEEITFVEWTNSIFIEWKRNVAEMDREFRRYQLLKEKKMQEWEKQINEVNSKYKSCEIDKDTFFQIRKRINEEKARFLYEHKEISFTKYKEAMGFFELENIKNTPEE